MFEELQRFLLLVEERNATKVADKVFITQSAMSQSIKRLEKELGVVLVIQKGKQLEITSDGLAVAEIGTKILQLWQKAKDPQKRFSEKQTISLGSFDNAALKLGKYFQDSIIKDTFKIELTINASGKIFSQITLGIYDIALCVVDKRKHLPKSLIEVMTFKEELIPVSSRKFDGRKESIPFILYNVGSNTRDQIDSIFAENFFKPTIFAESTSTTFMKELALLGSGIALLPKNSVLTEISQGLLKKHALPFKFHREYGLYLSKQSTVTKDHQIIKDICRILRK